MPAKPKPVRAARSSQREIEARWGEPALSQGFTAIPNVLLRYCNELELDSLDLAIVMHLASYWWDSGRLPHPSKGRIAMALNVDPRTVQRRIKAMEERGHIKRKARRSRAGDNDTNEYDLSGLVKEAGRLGARERDRKKTRAEEDDALMATPKSAALKVVKGGK